MKHLYIKTIISLAFFSFFAPLSNAAESCAKEKQILTACKRQYNSCPANERNLQNCLTAHGGYLSTNNCADELQAVSNCKAQYPGSSCPKTTAKYESCVAGGGGSSDTTVNSGKCADEQNELAACKVQHPGSSCPRTSAKLNACLGGTIGVASVGGNNGDNGKPSGQCSAQQQQLAACKAKYPGSSCPRTTEKLSECLNGGDSEEDQGGASGSTKCNKPNSQSDLQCMICNCYHEARGESVKGRLAVGKVVVTRRYTDRFPKTICGVIYQESQFSWTASSRKRNKTISGKDYRNCRKSSEDALKTKGNYAVHYHADYVSPKWANGCPILETIGNHIFYRDCDVWQANHRGSGTAQ